MRVLLIGSGARESALAWKLSHSKHLQRLFVYPAIPSRPDVQPLPELSDERSGEPSGKDTKPGSSPVQGAAASTVWGDVIKRAQQQSIDLIVCGPEQPLSEGLADLAHQKGIAIFGPHQQAAQLESSKAFTKDILKAAGVPTASFTLAKSRADCLQAARKQLEQSGGVVLKASGLAAGKGVFVCQSLAEVEAGLDRLYSDKMAKASETVVVEDLLIGRECSYFTFMGQKGTRHELGFAVDFKRLNDGDQGPNTGGMGAYAPVPWLPKDAAKQVQERVLKPLAIELAKRHITYTGCLYVGLMWHEELGPQVVEFNVRLGDPEAQVLAVQDERDWLELMADCCGLSVEGRAQGEKQQGHNPAPQDQGNLGEQGDADLPCVGVVLASADYPFGERRSDAAPAGDYTFAAETAAEKPAEGLAERLAGIQVETQVVIKADSKQKLAVFGAALSREDDRFRPKKGRVLTVVSRASSFREAREAAYERCAKIKGEWLDAHYRGDIAQTLLQELKQSNSGSTRSSDQA